MTVEHNAERHGYTVTYDSSSHVAVLFQRAGSIWPKVLPFCLINSIIAIIIQWLDSKENITLSISNTGHGFMNLMVAFLVVSRVSISIGRYNEARGQLAVMYRECRELLQNMVIFTEHLKDQAAKEWRLLVAHRSMLLLRAAMGAIDYQTDHVPIWELKEISQEEAADIKRNLYLPLPGSASGENSLRWGHEQKTVFEENLRVPVRMAYQLRKAIYSQQNVLSEPLALAHVNKLLGSVDSFMAGYYGIRKFLTTPFPFPLVQMARTFLFFYVFTVPFALLSDASSWRAHVVVVFILTYGLCGLEYTSIQLDNPFGDDDNDFDNLAMALTAFEDTYPLITEVDGVEWTDKLRALMFAKDEEDQGATEATHLLA